MSLTKSVYIYGQSPAAQQGFVTATDPVTNNEYEVYVIADSNGNFIGASNPLPITVDAATESSLSSISTADQATATAIGTQADASTTSSVVGLLKLVASKLGFSFNTDNGALSHITNWPATQTVSGTVSATVNTISNFALETGGNLSNIYSKLSGTLSVNTITGFALESGGNLAAILTKLNGSIGVTGTFWQSTQPVSMSAPPTGAALDSSVQSVLSAIKATINLAGTVWYDPTTTPPIYYVRRESVNEGTGAITVSWETPSGSAATPTIANLQAVSNNENIAVETLTFVATTSGTGYSNGDLLVHSLGIDTLTSPVSVAYSFWLDATSGVILSTAPTGGTYTQITTPVSGTITANLGTTDTANLSTIATAYGASGAGTNPGSGMLGWLSGIYAKLSGTIAVSTDGAAGTGGGALVGTGASGTIGWLATAAYYLSAISTKLAGTNLLGKVGIDQTTPGTTDSVTVKTSPYFCQRDTYVTAVSSGASTASGLYIAFATIDNSSLKRLCADFFLKAAAGATATAGNWQLYAVDYAPDGTQGPTLTSGAFPSGFQPRLVGSFQQNWSTTVMQLSLLQVPLSNKADYYLYNNATAQTIAAAWVGEYQTWSPAK